MSKQAISASHSTIFVHNPPSCTSLVYHSRGGNTMASTFRSALVVHHSRAACKNASLVSQHISRSPLPDALRTSYLFSRNISSHTSQKPSIQRRLATSPMSAPFHTSTRRQILPPGPREHHYLHQRLPKLIMNNRGPRRHW